MDRNVGFFKSIQFKLIIIYVLLILIAMQIFGVYFTNQLEQKLVSNYFSMLDERSNLLAYNIELEMTEPREDPSSLGRDIYVLLREFFSIEDSQVQVIDNNKVVITTSNLNNSHIIGTQITDVRVKRALLGTKDEGILRDPQTGHRMRVLALPIKSENEIIGAVYIQASMEEIYEQMEEINNILVSGTLIALSITALLVVLLARTITAPIKEMRKLTKRMGRGDFSQKVKVYGNDEIGQLAVSFNDLTIKLKEADATTEREQKRLSSVLAHMTDGVVATDEFGEVILLNKRAEELLGVTNKEAIGSSLPTILQITDGFNNEQLDDYSQSMILDFSTENRDFLIEANFSVIKKEDGQINGLIAVLHDVTEQEKIEQDRREFVANVSHELRTPLTTMKSYLEALVDGAMDDKEIAPRFLEVTQNETERMIRLVNALLQLSKMDSRDYKLSFEAIELNSFLHEIIERFEILAKEKELEFIRFIPTYETNVYIDRDKITQVLDNIISNAMKYSPVKGKITVHLLHQGHNVRISVGDEGIGIPRDSQGKIFDRFYRVDKARARNVGGTGLGLAIAKELVHAHGGEIWVQSDYGHGTTILFTLPYSFFKGAVKR